MTPRHDDLICAYCVHFTRKGIVPFCEHFRQTPSCYDPACQEYSHHLTGEKMPPRKEKAK